MTTINTSSLSLYNSQFTLASKSDQDKASEGVTTVGVNLRGTTSKLTDTSKKEPAAAKTPAEQAIEQLKERIAETQKRLAEQTRQLAAAQSADTDPQIKAQQVMAIQQQISGTTAELGAEQGSLMQLLQAQAKGSQVNTTA